MFKVGHDEIEHSPKLTGGVAMGYPKLSPELCKANSQATVI